MTSHAITLLRHGKVAGPAALYGHTDIALSAQGYSDLQASLSQLHSTQPIDSIISSPLIRCAQVARQFSSAGNIPLAIVPDLTEMHFGAWDGVPFDQLGDHWPSLEKFWQAPDKLQPPAGESLSDFNARVIAAWQALLQEHKYAHRVIICHGGVIRVIIAHILGLDIANARLFQQLHIDYASHSRIEVNPLDNSCAVIKWIGAPANK